MAQMEVEFQAVSKRDAMNPHKLLKALKSFKEGDFNIRLDAEAQGGVYAEIAEVFNSIVSSSDTMVKEFERVSYAVVNDGEFDQRAEMDASGSWQTMIDSFNNALDDMLEPTRTVMQVIDAVSEGELMTHVSLFGSNKDLQGEHLRIETSVNKMMERLNCFSDQVTRVVRDVGIEGKLGVQAEVGDLEGIWKELTNNVNTMAANLSGQVRAIANVTTAVANGDLTKKMTADAKGEILELKNTINTMVDQLGTFAAEVTRVAREVGTEGKLGGQAQVVGVGGTWKDLTDNVNTMAANLTGQV
jgi:HAMP domain-containing protein